MQAFELKVSMVVVVHCLAILTIIRVGTDFDNSASLDSR